MAADQTYAIYVINLDRSPQRWLHLQDDLSAQGLIAERVPAVDGKGKSWTEFPEFDPIGYARCHGREPMATEIGCYLSHVAVLRHFMASPHQHCVILEDDAQLGLSFAAQMADMIKNADAWDLLLLYGIHTGGPVVTRQTPAGNAIAALTMRQTGSTAYAINRACAKDLLANLIPMRVPYDHAYTLPWIHAHRMRACLPYPVPQTRPSPSTIGWTDRKNPSFITKMRVLWYRTQTETRRFCHYLMNDPAWLTRVGLRK